MNAHDIAVFYFARTSRNAKGKDRETWWAQ